MSKLSGIMNSVERANNENLDTLFPAGKKPDIVPASYNTDFLTSVRTRESKSAINSAAVDYNRWEFFPEGDQKIGDYFGYYTNLKN